MADGLNQVQLLGNLGADPELKMTSSGQACLRIRIATNKSYLDRNRVRQERVDWHGVIVWGKRAEALSRFLSQGSRIFVQGELRTSSWEDNDSVKRYRTEIIADKIILCGDTRARGGSGGQRSDADEYSRGDDEPNGGGGDDDIPF